MQQKNGISSSLMSHLARIQTFLPYFANLLKIAHIAILSYLGGLGSSVILSDLDRKNYSEKLISFLDPVLLSSQRSGFVRCWHAKTDGSAASTFHGNCDGKGPTVTIIKSGNYIFGAYTDVSWHSSKYLSDSCFLSPGEVLHEKFGGGVRPASQNPYPIYYQTKVVKCNLYMLLW